MQYCEMVNALKVVVSDTIMPARCLLCSINEAMTILVLYDAEHAEKKLFFQAGIYSIRNRTKQWPRVLDHERMSGFDFISAHKPSQSLLFFQPKLFERGKCWCWTMCCHRLSNVELQHFLTQNVSPWCPRIAAVSWSGLGLLAQSN